VARVIVLDLSQSMQAGDLTPNRLARARYKVADILARVKDGRVGLIAFAGEAFTVAPLTQDAATIDAMLEALQPNIMPVPGSRPDVALARAGALLQQAGARQGEVVLISDDAGDARAQAAAAALQAQGHRLAVIGVGTAAGAPVPGVRRAEGPVLAKLDVPALRALARAGGGAYATLTADDRDLDAVLLPDSAGRTLPAALSDHQAQAWYPLGPWIALAVLPLAALAFRRGWLLMTLPLLVSSLPAPALALGWDDLWLRPEQQAAQALEQGDHDRARELARDPQRRGAAAYRAGDYQAAAAEFAAGETVSDHYNRGNALARAGALKEALAAYDQALALESDHEDARYNRAQVEALLKQQEQQQQQDKPEQNGDESEQNQEQRQNQQQSQQQDQNQDNQTGEGEETADQPDAGGEEDMPERDQQAEAQAAEDYRDAAEAAQPTELDQSPPEEQPMAEPPLAEQTPQEREARAAAEQWLRRIPDDPGGLLRRKFLYQYSQRAGPERDMAAGEPW
jgi:Ca-activated chloride channel family protein